MAIDQTNKKRNSRQKKPQKPQGRRGVELLGVACAGEELRLAFVGHLTITTSNAARETGSAVLLVRTRDEGRGTRGVGCRRLVHLPLSSLNQQPTESSKQPWLKNLGRTGHTRGTHRPTNRQQQQQQQHQQQQQQQQKRSLHSKQYFATGGSLERR